MFNTQLRKAREAMGLSQGDVSNLTGIPTSTICKYETGKSQPGISKILQLMKVYNVDADFLFCDEIAAAEISSVAVSPEEKDVLYKYRTLDGPARNMLGNVLEYAAQEASEAPSQENGST